MRMTLLSSRVVVAAFIGMGCLLFGTGMSRAEAKARVAVPEFKVEGDANPALRLQLQDGFVLGLVGGGLQVLDPVDLARRLEGNPELAGCDSSPCLKNIGRLLDVSYVVRVRVEVAGNSYRMAARLFSTEGSAPAVLPIATKTRHCDVCTVAEAREHMIRLADAVRPEIDVPVAPVPAPIAQPSPPSLVRPMVAAMAGAVAVATGIALLVTMSDCGAPVASTANPTPTAMPMAGPTCDENRTHSAIAGGLIGAGLATSAVGTYVTITRMRAPHSASPSGAAVSVAFRF